MSLKLSNLLLSFLIGLSFGGPITFADERYPGGLQGTVKDTTENAFGHPLPILTREQKREFFVGNSFFRQAWVQAPASTDGRDGVGPTWNAVSCATCHFKDGRGRGAGGKGAFDGIEHSLLYRFSDNSVYGNQLQPFGNPGIPGEARPEVTYRYFRGKYQDGDTYELREPVVNFRDWAFGKPTEDLKVSTRVANQMIGLGLLELIPEADILANVDPDDQKNADGISGEAIFVLDIATGLPALGRFGWQSEQPNVRQQTAAAFNGDMGLTTELFPEENCPAPQVKCAQAIKGGTPEVEAKAMDRITLYSSSLAVPERRNMEDPRVIEGKKQFRQIGCATCHQPSWKLADDWTIYPYTDMLLHDLGMGLGDQTLARKKMRTQWRTPPLWGIGLVPTVNGHTELLHDGRARNIEEAILWHNGEAFEAKEIFLTLTREERGEIIEFIKSL